METLIVTLRQHTPLIHFQHDQDGATLRASEVKPKLDRFLAYELKDDEYIAVQALSYCKSEKTRKDIKGFEFQIFNIKKKWMDENGSFAYQLRITTNPEDKIKTSIPIEKNKDEKYEAKFPFVLANLDEKETKAELINFSFYQKIQLHFIAKDKKMIDKINEYIDIFFAFHNFGNRQNKGFGCFFRDGSKLEFFKQNLAYYYNDLYGKQFKYYNRNNYEELERFFNALEKDYKKLKSGLGKSPSLINDYAISIGYEWEKSAIKAIKKGAISPPKSCYLRAALGITDAMAYTKENQVVKIKHISNNSQNEIKRYQSPITFKVFDNWVFAIPEDTIASIMGQQFEFSIYKEKKIDKKKVYTPVKPPFTLTTVGESFNFTNFLDDALPKLKWQNIKL